MQWRGKCQRKRIKEEKASENVEGEATLLLKPVASGNSNDNPDSICYSVHYLDLLLNCSSILMGQLFDSEIEDMKQMFQEEKSLGQAPLMVSCLAGNYGFLDGLRAAGRAGVVPPAHMCVRIQT